MGLGTLQKTGVGKLRSSLHLQMQAKTLPCKVKAIYQQHPEMSPTPLSLRSSVMD